MEVSGRRQLGSNDLSTGLLCDPCKGEDEEKNAIFYCTVCNEFLCDMCTKAHRRVNVSKHHHLLDRDNMPKQKFTSSEENMCIKHKDKLVEYYCKIHGDCCCSVCATIEHKQCQVEYIEDIAIDFETSKEYKIMMNVISDLTLLLQNTKKMALKKKDEVEHIQNRFVSEVNTFRSEINHVLDSLEQITLQEAKTVRDKDTKFTEFASLTCDAIIADLEEMSSRIDKHKEYKQQRQLVISAKKAQIQIKQFERFNAELNKQCTIREYSFRPNETILQSIKAVNSLGKLDDRKKEEEKPKIDTRTETISAPSKSVSLRYVGEIDIQHSTDASEYICSIPGGVMLENNMLALADFNNSIVKVVDVNSNKVISSIKVPTEPWDITRVERDQIVVTCRHKLVFIKVGKTLSVVKELDIGGLGHCIFYTNNTFICSFESDGCVKILDLDGHLIKTITRRDIENYMLIFSDNIALSTDMKTLYVADKNNSSVTSMDLDGTVQHIYTHDELMYPINLAVDREGNIFIAGMMSNNIHIISPQCTTIRVLQMISPQAVIYCERDNKLYISHNPAGGYPANKLLSVYQIE